MELDTEQRTQNEPVRRGVVPLALLADGHPPKGVVPIIALAAVAPSKHHARLVARERFRGVEAQVARERRRLVWCSVPIITLAAVAALKDAARPAAGVRRARLELRHV